jgi:hypothetical protein
MSEMAPRYLRNAECQHCFKTRPLVIATPLEAVGGSLRPLLCLGCRLNWRDGEWCILASTLAHSVARQWAAGIGGIPAYARDADA